ncbi:hypothetical protein KUH03_07220 [Sphingobacterium sp. E70]|uniref:hypothetical protein n=1 Tax=Sphingobacterium sp. E70 TaxID=2853439 RepID=UPI00211C1B69|nr:hypothetical protein [Sphingobacterium sp. E70]ULT26628.1 hypothetical protein KUH03_07220 [Sphingobacterium sp. E70]
MHPLIDDEMGIYYCLCCGLDRDYYLFAPEIYSLFDATKISPENEEVIEPEIVDSKLDEPIVYPEKPTNSEQVSGIGEVQTIHSDPPSVGPNSPQQLNLQHTAISVDKATEMQAEQQKKDRRLLMLQRVSFTRLFITLFFVSF